MNRCITVNVKTKSKDKILIYIVYPQMYYKVNNIVFAEHWIHLSEIKKLNMGREITVLTFFFFYT